MGGQLKELTWQDRIQCGESTAWAHSRFSGKWYLCLVLLRPPRACPAQQQVPLLVPKLLTSHRLPRPTPRPPRHTEGWWAPPQPPGGLESRGQKFPSSQRKPGLWEIFFLVIRRPEGSPNQWKLTEQIKRHKTPKELPGPLGSEARHCIYVQMEPD